MNQEPLSQGQDDAERLRRFFRTPDGFHLSEDLMEIDLDDYVDQLRGVSDAESEAHRKHRDNVYRFAATPEEIEEWYYAEDPVNDTHYLMLDMTALAGDREGLVSVYKEQVKNTVALGRGGTALLASVILPEAFESPQDWYKALSEQHADRANGEANTTTPKLSHNDILELCLERIRTGAVVTQHDLMRLYIGAEMMLSSGRNLQKLHSDYGGEVVLQDWDAAGLDALLENYSTLTQSVLRFISTCSLRLTDPRSGEAITSENRLLGLRAGLLFASRWMGPAFSKMSEEDYARSREEFGLLVETVRLLMLTPEYGFADRLKKSAVKGPLHETLWYLDTYVARHLSPDELWDVEVFPSYLKGDAPRIGRPEHKRGYDFMVQRGRLTDLVQLKSSRQHTKRQTTVMGKNGVPMNSSGYHPAIMVLCEENFQDTDPRRLKARLALYERFYEDGVTDDNAPRLSQYILKTASFEMKRIQMMRRDRMTALRNIVTQQYIVPNLVEYRPVGMSRQQRRAYERRQRRQGSRGKR